MRMLLAILLALTGAVFCAVSALDLTAAFCTTAGCALFKGASIAGLSLYWIGAAGFFTLAVLYSVGRRQPLVRQVADCCLAVGLVFDAVLLGILAVTVPCLTCLVVAALLGGTALAAWPAGWRWRWMRWRVVLLAWSLLFAAGMTGLGRGAVSPVPLAAESSAPAALQLYFSPTCPECRTAVLRILARPELLQQTAFYAIAKTAEDERRLLALRAAQHAAQHGAPPLADLLRALVDDDRAPDTPADAGENLAVWLMSMRNKIAVMQAGSQTVPFLQANAPGMLSLLTPPAAPASGGDAPSSPSLPSPSMPSPSMSSPSLPGLSLPGLLQAPGRASMSSSTPANSSLAPSSQGCGFADQTPCD